MEIENVSGNPVMIDSDHLSSDIAVERIDTLDDAQLLERFLGGGGEVAEAAFSSLVVRHGPMVLGVCRHVLSQHQDAEDAFQATFLVLARKAASIRDRAVLGRWLYEVAYRTAIRAKTQANKRRAQERQGAEMSATDPGFDPAWTELKPVLHDEVNRLPEKYRTPVVLCYLEGKTNEEAARLLDWPVGTVKGRLSRARDLLRSRLIRRGLALSAGFLGTALAQERVFAEVVPVRLVEATVAGAVAMATGQGAGALSARVAELVEHVLEFELSRIERVSARWTSQLVIAMVGVLMVASTLTGVALAAGAAADLKPRIGAILMWTIGAGGSATVSSCHSTS
jgi:RNA polymerase sigma factor (sigma-70 family)